MKLLNAYQMRELDRCAIEDYAVPGIVLMENAGRGAADIVDRRYRHLLPGPILVVAGKGNNGGDGYVMARHLENRGWQVETLVLASREEIGGDAAINLNILEKSHRPVKYAISDAEIDAALQHCPDVALIVDAIFGNGLSSTIRGHYLHAIRQINALSLPVVAVDLPSGVDATTGEILGDAINADCSITFAFAKLGQVNYPARRCGGDLFVVDIGMPQQLQKTVSDQYVLVDDDQACILLPQRPTDGHKGTFGHALVVAGSKGKGGAAQMSAVACLRSGSGLVTLATPAAVQPLVATAAPEIMTVPLPEIADGLAEDSFAQIKTLWQDKTVVAFGPGLGQTAQVEKLAQQIVAECPHSLVIDADGLNALQHHQELLVQRPVGKTVVTPHPGEMARLTGLSVTHIQNHRCEVASQFAAQWQVVVVLKGARTVIAESDGRTWINGSGNSGMGSGGMGDILTGVIAGGLAQGLDLFSATVLGVYLHGKAADRCKILHGGVGYLATDLLPQLPVVRQTLMDSMGKG
ncbi:MAG: NAD(P)H-hydrate dehydratase [Thermodesulfobacteriota bacterium]|nr:NAD(P)H-hydrate dehydratase [Thermodesulfobacteriota bacterium]